MRKPVLDSSAFIAYKKQVFADVKIVRSMALSMIVLYELTATNITRDTLQIYEDWRKEFYADGVLIVPSMLDFWNTAKKVRALKIAEEKDYIKFQQPADDAIRLQNDALIAYTVGRRDDCYLVTQNVKDFKRLQRVIDFDYESAEDFFGY